MRLCKASIKRWPLLWGRTWGETLAFHLGPCNRWSLRGSVLWFWERVFSFACWQFHLWPPWGIGLLQATLGKLKKVTGKVKVEISSWDKVSTCNYAPIYLRHPFIGPERRPFVDIWLWFSPWLLFWQSDKIPQSICLKCYTFIHHQNFSSFFKSSWHLDLWMVIISEWTMYGEKCE